MEVVDAEHLEVDGARGLGRLGLMVTVAMAVVAVMALVAMGLRRRCRQGEHREEGEKDARHAPPLPSWRKSGVTSS